MKGFILEVISLIAVLLGIVVAIKFSPNIANFLETSVEWSSQVIRVMAYAIAFALALVVVFLAGKLLTKLIEAVALGLFNKIVGALFGLLKYGMILSVLLILFQSVNKKMNLLKEDTLKNSVLFDRVKNVAPLIFPLLLDLEKEIKTNVGQPTP
ncbi:CvpA family protein [Flavobacteriaceae bacterium F08102]|nr:CvpA family protein [Flavobacteriaceae bacterium F08102]